MEFYMKKLILGALALISLPGLAVQPYRMENNKIAIELHPGDVMSFILTNNTGHDIEVFPAIGKESIVYFGDKPEMDITELLLVDIINNIKSRTKSQVLTLSDLKKEISNDKNQASIDKANEVKPVHFSGICLFIRTGMALKNTFSSLVPYSLLSASLGWGASTLTGKGNPLKVASITGLLCAAYYGWQIKNEDGKVASFFQGMKDLETIKNTTVENISDFPVELVQKITRAEKLIDTLKQSIIVKHGKSIKGFIVAEDKFSFNKKAQKMNSVQLKIKQCNIGRIMNIDIPVLHGPKDCFLLGLSQANSGVTV